MATFQLAELRKAFADHGGIARGQKFRVLISKPKAIATVPDALQLMCETVSLPTRSAATNELSMYGPVQSFPYRFTFTEASLNFYLTEDFAIKKIFDTWQEKIIDPVSGNLGYFDDYKCSIDIEKFGGNDFATTANADYKVKLIDAWPSIVGEVALGHSLGTDILRLPVTFQFRKWEMVDTGDYQLGDADFT
ncbi:hypothetical protein CMI37_22825 [Candidatus Pacearchaeota archaeon]|nr:hypothetical protein [Candidatus Pacearchaeota archaeon]|tara:strand:- start:49 stop:624 length:576 start_codon:yes stop_codon:yes gene_type:complete